MKFNIVQARVTGSPSNTTPDFKKVSTRNASVIGITSTLDTQTSTGVKDRLIQKCQQELEVNKNTLCILGHSVTVVV